MEDFISMESMSFLFLSILAALFLLWLGWRLRMAWKNFLFSLVKRRGKRGEKRAIDLLEKNGYKILQSELPLTGSVDIDNKPEKFNVRVDYLVEREGRKYLAEVKTGLAARSGNSATRRQLREYAAIVKSDTILLVDATSGQISQIRFNN